MTGSLIRRAVMCAGIVALAVSLVGQTASAEKPPKADKLPICTVVGDIAKWNGATWECAPDVDTTDTDWNNLTNVPADIADGDDDTDTLADLNCVEEGDIAVFSGGQWECESDVGLVDNGDGTVTDHDTGLMWEKKEDCGGVNLSNPHCQENLYTWTGDGVGGTAANGTLYTDFLVKLNLDITNVPGATCFANYCDWRIPNLVELQRILLEPFLCSISPCIDPIFGPTQQSFYWSSSSLASDLVFAWDVFFVNGNVLIVNKFLGQPARAVRGGR